MRVSCQTCTTSNPPIGQRRRATRPSTRLAGKRKACVGFGSLSCRTQDEPTQTPDEAAGSHTDERSCTIAAGVRGWLENMSGTAPVMPVIRRFSGLFRFRIDLDGAFVFCMIAFRRLLTHEAAARLTRLSRRRLGTRSRSRSGGEKKKVEVSMIDVASA